MSETNVNTELSRSKQKRIEQEKNRQEARRQAAMARFWSVAIPGLIVLAIIVGVVVWRQSRLDYSRYYNDYGALKGISASGHVTVNTGAMSFSRAELLPEDSKVESDIASDLSSHQTLSDDGTLSIADGDKVRISYTATIDEESYKDVSEGTDYTVGSGEIGEEFDDVLIGCVMGDDVSTTVSFPDDYEDASAAGKVAEYDIHVEGIYVDPVLDDSYVKEYHSDKASTVEEYRQSIIDGYYESSLRDAVSKSISVNSTVSSVPDGYLKNCERVLRAEDLEQMNYMNSLYQQMLGYVAYNSVYESRGLADEEAYNAELKERARIEAERGMEIQYIADQAGIVLTDADVTAYYVDKGYTEESLKELQNSRGKGYVAHAVLEQKVIDHLMQTVTIN
ncbi:MAG: hypothetical protein IK115_05600 [Lachnospiraceae bacterium]|nr:hypothetical protein [Lachnospiraceae bacterium]